MGLYSFERQKYSLNIFLLGTNIVSLTKALDKFTYEAKQNGFPSRVLINNSFKTHKLQKAGSFYIGKNLELKGIFLKSLEG